MAQDTTKLPSRKAIIKTLQADEQAREAARCEEAARNAVGEAVQVYWNRKADHHRAFERALRKVAERS